MREKDQQDAHFFSFIYSNLTILSFFDRSHPVVLFNIQ